jgi:hypothetical protein
MGRRTRKPQIRQEQRRDWLKRIEEGGESPPEIAGKDDFDVRTVRTQIEIAKQEREVREAKVLILRNAMELHYNDMRKFVEKLNSQISGKGNVTPGPDDEFIEAALRQHIPRSLIWGYLHKEKTLQIKSNEQIKQIEGMIEEVDKADERLTPLIVGGMPELISIIAKNLAAQVLPWSNGATERHLRDTLRVENVGKGTVEIWLGSDLLVKMNEKDIGEDFKILGDVCDDMELKLKESDLYHDFEATRTEIKKLDRKLREELVKIRLKRIVPGHCDLCPL